MDALTVDEFKKALPPSLKKSVNSHILNYINQTLSDPDMYETYRDNLLGYTHVMQEGKFKVSSYIDAVKYISHKLMGKTNIAAYTATFPDKVADFQRRGISAKDIASYCTAYNKSKLVTLLYAQTLTPFYVLNQDVYQKAINTQAELMLNAKSEKVRSDAANSILNHLKPPETQKVELNVSTGENSAIAALRETTEQLVAQQKQAILSGSMNAGDVAKSKLVFEGDFERVEKDE